MWEVTYSPPTPPGTELRTDRAENITFRKLRMFAVKSKGKTKSTGKNIFLRVATFDGSSKCIVCGKGRITYVLYRIGFETNSGLVKEFAGMLCCHAPQLHDSGANSPGIARHLYLPTKLKPEIKANIERALKTDRRGSTGENDL